MVQRLVVGAFSMDNKDLRLPRKATFSPKAEQDQIVTTTRQKLGLESSRNRNKAANKLTCDTFHVLCVGFLCVMVLKQNFCLNTSHIAAKAT